MTTTDRQLARSCRIGYFVADRKDHRADKPVFNRSVTLRDTWSAGA